MNWSNGLADQEPLGNDECQMPNDERMTNDEIRIVSNVGHLKSSIDDPFILRKNSRVQ